MAMIIMLASCQSGTNAWTQSTGKRAMSQSSHFHCYLLRSLDPQHSSKTYIGCTTDPFRRLRQHNGELKSGGAKRTQRSGRPWEYVAIIHDFPNQRKALQFEWAWQHGGKSLAVRNAIGDREAKALARKQGVVGKLAMLKTLVNECESLCATNQTICFFEDLWKSEFDDISTRSGTQVPARVSTQLAKVVQEMPFWKDRGKAKITDDNIEDDRELDNGSDEDDTGNERRLHSIPGSNPYVLDSRRTALTRSFVTLAAATSSFFPKPVEASQPSECDDDCLASRKQIIADRRAMMRQSMTTTNRQDMFELSRQRAALYNTTYRGAKCLPGIPCL